jgi:hypothetical protein
MQKSLTNNQLRSIVIFVNCLQGGCHGEFIKKMVPCLERVKI